MFVHDQIIIDGDDEVHRKRSRLRGNLDYQGIARRLSVTDSLSKNVLPSYDKEIDTSAVCLNFEHDEVVIDSNDEISQYHGFLGTRKVTIPTFEVFSNPTVKISDIMQRRFSIINRATKKVQQQIMKEEDWKILNLLDKVSK